MKTLVRLAVVVLITLASLANRGLGQTDVAPVVSGIHWITIHAKTPEAFDSLHGLLTRDMKLPVYFGPSTLGPRRYLAVGAGRVILELCGPFPDSPYRDRRALARFNSVFMRPGTSLAASVTGLVAREIRHEPPGTVPWDTTERHVKLTALSAAGMPVTLSERVKDAEALKGELDALRKDLDARQGGPLGIRELEEVHIAYSDESRLSTWQAFIKPDKPEGSLWNLPEKPGLRFVRDDRDEVVALVFKVGSLDQAIRQLKALDLLGAAHENTVSLAAGRTCGLRILLTQ